MAMFFLSLSLSVSSSTSLSFLVLCTTLKSKSFCKSIKRNFIYLCRRKKDNERERLWIPRKAGQINCSNLNYLERKSDDIFLHSPFFVVWVTKFRFECVNENMKMNALTADRYTLRKKGIEPEKHIVCNLLLTLSNTRKRNYECTERECWVDESSLFLSLFGLIFFVIFLFKYLKEFFLNKKTKRKHNDSD